MSLGQSNCKSAGIGDFASMQKEYQAVAEYLIYFEYFEKESKMIVSKELIGKLSEELKQSGKRIVFTNGCFDIIHAGHVKYLAEARNMGDVLIVGMNTDESVRSIKGPTRPINNETDRAAVLEALRSVDIVTLFGEDTPELLIRSIVPDVLVKGGDYTYETIVGAEFVSANGGRVATIPLVEGKSTTNIIAKAGE